MMVTAYIGLGSNLDEPTDHVERASSQIGQHPNISLTKRSNWYGSRAIGPGEQPDYVNGVVEISTDLNASALLIALQEIEHLHGRQRTQRWAARTLDLDLLYYGGQSIDLPDLQVPHPRISQRNFVLLPLNELAPNIIIGSAQRGQKVAELAESIDKDGIWKL